MHRRAKRGYADGGPVGGAAGLGQPAALNAKIVNVLDPAEIVSAALATEAGEKVIMNFMSANSRRVNAALGS
jgi:hypothetical protein